MSDNNEHKSSDQIEREVEQERARVSETLDALRDSMSPGQMVDQLVGYARESGGGDFVRNLGRQMRDNPMPVVLMGAGLAWLAAASALPQRPRGVTYREPYPARDYDDGSEYDIDNPYLTDEARLALEARPSGPGMRDRVKGAAHGVGDAAHRAGTGIKDAGASAGASAGRAASAIAGGASAGASAIAGGASAAYSGASHAASGAVHSVGGAFSATRDAAYYAGRRASRASHGLMELFDEQPLVLGAIGLAVGAAIGAALPATETEDDMLGRRSDAMKDSARDMAAEQYEKAKSVAERTYTEAKKEADAQGLTPDAARDQGRSFADKARKVAEAAGRGAKDEAKQQDLGPAGTTSSGSGVGSTSSSGTTAAGTSGTAAAGTSGTAGGTGGGTSGGTAGTSGRPGTGGTTTT